jgi:hypothetical protein
MSDEWNRAEHYRDVATEYRRLAMTSSSASAARFVGAEWCPPEMTNDVSYLITARDAVAITSWATAFSFWRDGGEALRYRRL